VKACEQCQRGKEYLLNNKIPIYYNSDKKKERKKVLEVNSTNNKKIFKIAVVLDEYLDLAELSNRYLGEKYQDTWVVNIFALHKILWISNRINGINTFFEYLEYRTQNNLGIESIHSDDLYAKFDLMDMLRLRKKDFFDSKVEEPFHIESPILKTKKGFNFIEIEAVQHEMIFELYHASLKQFESLPRCVFLYRAFEFGNNFYYNPTYHPQEATPQAALSHLFTLAMDHNYMPLYYVDFGTYRSEDNSRVIRKRKASYKNFLLALKIEARKIVQEWSVHTYVQNMTIGEVIYKTGRNASAHGGAEQHNARYDYNRNYRHINDVNIILELIVRYLI